jgi:hypothetical protein
MVHSRDLEGLSELLAGAPLGEYLLEQTADQRILWRITAGAEPDGALEPAPAWWMNHEPPEAQPPAQASPEPKPPTLWRWCRRRWLGPSRGAMASARTLKERQAA